MLKTPKKNKTIVWPTNTMFTLKEIFSLNPVVKQITLRVRLSKEKDNGKIVELGALTGGKGRPEKVFTYAPISKLIIDKARAQKINLADGVASAVQPTTATSTVA